MRTLTTHHAARLRNILWRGVVAFLLSCAAMALPQQARAAASCSTTTSSLAFGNVDVLPGTQVDGAGSITIACSGFTATQKLTLCFGLDNGTYPASGSNRQMGSAASRLVFNVFKDAARSVIWTTASAGLISVTITSSTLNQVIPYYGRILGSQQAAIPAAYTTTLSQPVTGQFYTTGTVPVCGALASFGADPLAVSATVVSSCTVTATTLDFGATSLLAANIDATSSLSVICTQSTPYQVRLSGGGAAAVNPAPRQMSLGVNKIDYGLYRDAARLLYWGAADGVDTAPGAGTSSAIAHTVYGRIPPQALPPPGVYTDTVVVTVSFL